MTPSADPVDVFVHTGPAEWWQVLAALGPLAVLLAALIGAVISLRTLRQRAVADSAALAQKREADNRSEWWNRTQWALDSSLSADPRRAELGLGVLAVLAESGLASPEELEIITVAWEDPLTLAPPPAATALAPEAIRPGREAASPRPQCTNRSREAPPRHRPAPRPGHSGLGQGPCRGAAAPRPLDGPPSGLPRSVDTGVRAILSLSPEGETHQAASEPAAPVVSLVT